MSTKFDWQTDDETSWKAEAPGVERTAVSIPRRWLLWGGVLLLLLSIGALIAYSQLNKQVQITTSNAENELLTTHQLLHEAARNEDAELFQSMLAGGNSVWTQSNITLLARQKYLDRAPLGLWYDIDAEPDWTENVQVTLSPDFTQAELNVPLPYVYFDEAGELESVQLWQTAVYHKS
ncbi:MAG: hypothetical protein GY943_30680, partial [Chloroflexi bacterium]|nr:hypothetical protein [Chloroflexota bacterium]